MADNGRWFKLWITAPYDPHLSNLSLDDFARWCLFGIYLKTHGNNGVIELTSPATAIQQLFRVQNYDDVMQVIQRFPSCNFTVTSVTTATVTWCNWLKYQGDFSGDRVRKFRDVKRTKKRGEEKRREEIRKEEKEEDKKEEKHCGPKVKPSSTSAAKMPDSEWLDNLKQNPAYKRIDVETLYNKMLAWCELKGKKPTKARLLNWLNREEVPLNGQKKSAWEQIMEDEYGSEGSGQGALIPANRLP